MTSIFYGVSKGSAKVTESDRRGEGQSEKKIMVFAREVQREISVSNLQEIKKNGNCFIIKIDELFFGGKLSRKKLTFFREFFRIVKSDRK